MLRDSGISHRVFLRNPAPYIDHDDTVIGSLDDDGCLRDLLAGCTTVIHCAARVWPRKGRNAGVLHVNTGLTRRLYMAAAAQGTSHFVHVSSIHSMAVPPASQPMDESAALISDPRMAYDYSKAESERFLQSAQGPPVAILNPTAIIGPGDHYLHGMNQLFRRVVRNRLHVLVAGGFDVVDVRDVAAAVIRTAVQGSTGKYMLSGKYHTVADLVRAYGRVNEVRVPGLVLPAWLMRLGAAFSVPAERLSKRAFAFNTYSVDTLLHGHRNIRSDKARRELGYTNRSLEETLHDLHEWLLFEKLEL